MADLITGVRLLLVAPAALAFARPDYLPPLLLIAVLVVAIATDFLDGLVARRTKTSSARGQLFDHSTDFLFVTCGLAGASVTGQVPLVLPILIVVAFSQYVLDSYFLHRQKRLHMSFIGRWNGILYFVPLVLIAVSRFDVMAGIATISTALIVLVSNVLLLSTVASIIDRAIARKAT